jgi:uncharacterized Zn-binding protein involved in type VI secretion
MTKARAFVLGAGAAFGLLALVAIVGAPALAAPPATGDWNVTGVESYANQVITLTNVTDGMGNVSAFGNLTVSASATLTFDNVTLVLPFQSTVDVQGRAVFRNSTVQGETWTLWIRGQAVFNRDTFVNATAGGTIINSTTSTLDRIVWDCGGGAGTVHVQQLIDFKNHTLQNGCVVSWEPSALATNRAVEISNVSVVDAGGGTGFTFADVYHTGYIQYDMHHLFISNMSGWGIYIGVTGPNTTYLIHDSRFVNTGSAAIRSDSFEGNEHIWNCSFVGVLRAARMDGLPGGSVVATLDNITVIGTTASILADDMTWIVRNSTIGGAPPQFEAGPNGHILIYDSVDSALASGTPGAGGSIEHFIMLNMGVPSWQNAVPIASNLVTLLDANGGTTLQVDPSNWTPREIVWWGMYPGGNVDNRQLRPTIQDGGISFNCTPSSFLVSPGMPLVNVVCTDDAAPKISAITPTFPRFQNSTTVSGTARVDEAGSGLTTVEFSLDNASYAPVTFAPGDTHNFSFSRAGVPDAVYRIWLRAGDRTGNVLRISVGPVTVDTVAPALTIDPLPAVFSGSSYTIAGTTEANTTVTIAHARGSTNTTRSDANGTFAVAVPLDEGLNVYTVTARDQAGNAYSLAATTIVDSAPPSLAVLLDGWPSATAYGRLASVTVEAFTEATAQVQVNGLPAARSGEAFSLALPLALGLNNITVVATDVAGNSAMWSGQAYFDEAPPMLTATVDGNAPSPGERIITRSASVAIAGTASDNDTALVSLLINGISLTPGGSGAFSVALALGEGENLVTVTASDAVGNTASWSVTIVRDTTTPGFVASIDSDAGAVVHISGVAYTRGATARLLVVATENGTATFAGASHRLAAGDNAFVVALVEGRNTFTISVSDLAGNTAAPSTLIVERNNGPPGLTVSTPTEGASTEAQVVEVVGTADPSSTVKVNGQAVAVLSTGQFRAQVALSPGSNTVHVEAADALGNTKEANRTVLRTSAGGAAGPSGGTGDSLNAILFLVVGLAAGAAVGLFWARGRRTAKAAPPPASEGPVAAAPARAEVAQKGPKGPKGPRQP